MILVPDYDLVCYVGNLAAMVTEDSDRKGATCVTVGRCAWTGKPETSTVPTIGDSRQDPSGSTMKYGTADRRALRMAAESVTAMK
jgi:hypothetical protein